MQKEPQIEPSPVNIESRQSKMYIIYDNVIKIFREVMENWTVELTAEWKRLME